MHGSVEAASGLPASAGAPLAAPLPAPLAAPLAAPLPAPVVAPLPAPLDMPLAIPLDMPLATPLPDPLAAPVLDPLVEPLLPDPLLESSPVPASTLASSPPRLAESPPQFARAMGTTDKSGKNHCLKAGAILIRFPPVAVFLLPETYQARKAPRPLDTVSISPRLGYAHGPNGGESWAK